MNILFKGGFLEACARAVAISILCLTGCLSGFSEKRPKLSWGVWLM